MPDRSIGETDRNWLEPSAGDGEDFGRTNRRVEPRSFSGPGRGDADIRSGPGETRTYYRAGYLRSYGRQTRYRGFIGRAAEQVVCWLAGREADRREDGPYRGVGPRAYRRPDARVAEDVNEQLTDHPWLDARDIEVSVMAGAVTLSGAVFDREARLRAERCALRVAGVTQVCNNLRVGAARF